MNNSRNKKLLASFLTALGLTTNSANVNVSANFKQFGRDLRFACKILGGQKVKERNELDAWVSMVDDQLKSFIEDKKRDRKCWYLVFYDAFLDLFDTLDKLQTNRNGFNSELISSLNNVQGLKEFRESLSKHSHDVMVSQLSDENGNIKLTSDSLKYEDVLKICKPIYENVYGGKLSAWTPRVNNTLRSLCKNQEITNFMINFEKTHTKQENNVQNNLNQNNNINQNLISNNNNSQKYHGESWQENCEYIAKVISNDFNNINGKLQQAINPAYARNWLVKMVMGVRKHAIKPIDEAINQNNELFSLSELKRILQGDICCDNFNFYWNDKGNLEFCLAHSSLGNAFISFSFAFDKNHVYIYDNDGLNSEVFKSIDGNFIVNACPILSFDLPEEYNVPTPQKNKT